MIPVLKELTIQKRKTDVQTVNIIQSRMCQLLKQVQSSTGAQDGEINSGWGDLEGWASRNAVENSAPQ